MNAIIEAIIERMTIYINMMVAVKRREITQADANELMGHMGAQTK